MTSIRETIARAIYKGMFEEGELIGEGTTEGVMLLCGDEADAVLRALDEAGLVVVRKAPKHEAIKTIVETAWVAVYETGGMGAAHFTDLEARRIVRAAIAASVVE